MKNYTGGLLNGQKRCRKVTVRILAVICDKGDGSIGDIKMAGSR
jgi:hypothetical protein